MNATAYIALCALLETAGFDAPEVINMPGDDATYVTWRGILEYGPVQVNFNLYPTGLVSNATVTLWDEHIETELAEEAREGNLDCAVDWVGAVLTKFRALHALANQ